MQNQDPLSPLENHQILQQISQIREIESTDRFRQTLDAVLLGQNLSNASGLIEKQVKALSDSGAEVAGVVQRVSVAEGDVRVHIGEHSIKLTNIREIAT
jgi:flagellar basal-body rod modification protein FlgD